MGVLPTSGTGGWEFWVMPIFVLMLRPFGLLVQVVRGTMLSSLASPYIKTARAKGLPRRAVVFGHALRNSLLPVITVAGDLATGLVNGAVIVESVFRSEEHTSELQSLMRISYAVFCLKKK